MKIPLLLILAFFALASAAQEVSPDEVSIQEAYETFSAGRYIKTRELLDNLARAQAARRETNKSALGLVAYWRGITANRQSEFTSAIQFFEEALSYDFRPKDIYYEYGQALYASEKLYQARKAFAESYKRGHKVPVCLYYLGYISHVLGDDKKALTFFNAIPPLETEEAKEVLQPALMQKADIFLEMAEKTPEASGTVRDYVLPHYREALAVNPDSGLADEIKARITGLQQKYELILFRMRNGRPTPVPPYFLRAAQDFTYDTNPVFAATETTNSSAKQGSFVSKSDVIGRYTFFHKNIMSISPEFRANYTRYLKRVPAIYRNDNWMVAPALRTAYEHRLGERQASTLADIDYNYSNRDRNAEQKLMFNSRVTTFTVGERVVNLFGVGETTFRLRHRILDSYLNTADSKTNGAGLEHVLPLAGGQLYIFNLGYDQTRVNSKLFDTNTLFMRADVIMPAMKWKLTPQAGLGLTITDPLHNPARGTEKTWNPSVRLSRPLGGGLRLSAHADYMENQSKDKVNYAYKKTFYGLELEYVF